MTSPTRARAERGAVTTIVAVLLVGGVLMGFLALSLDVGQVLVEKRQLQNSADAGALSLAQSCWKTPGGTGCVAGADSLAGLVDANANDRVSGIQSQCSTNVPGSSLPGCGASTGAWADCAPLPPALDPAVTPIMAGLPYVEVRTRTQTANGGGPRNNFMNNWVAGLIGTSTSSAGACARAAVGVPGEGTADVPLTFSGCDWQHATGGTTGGGGGAYYTPPVYTAASPNGYNGAGQPPWPAAAATPPAQNVGGEVILLAQNPPGGGTPATPCPSWQGHALPGGFGVLDTEPGQPCVFKQYPLHWMHTSTGNNIGCNLSLLVGKVINLPIFDCTNDSNPGVEPPVNGCTTGNGNNAWFHRAGYAAFYLSGYSINVTSGIPNQKKSLVSGNFPCNGADTCLSGWFINGEVSATSISAPPSVAGFGTWTVLPAG